MLVCLGSSLVFSRLFGGCLDVVLGLRAQSPSSKDFLPGGIEKHR